MSGCWTNNAQLFGEEKPMLQLQACSMLKKWDLLEDLSVVACLILLKLVAI